MLPFSPQPDALSINNYDYFLSKTESDKTKSGKRVRMLIWVFWFYI